MATNKTPRKHPKGDWTIEVLQKDYVKLNKSAKRFALYGELARKNGGVVTVQQYVDACARMGDDKGAADIRWDSSTERRDGKPIIRLHPPKQAAKAA